MEICRFELSGEITQPREYLKKESCFIRTQVTTILKETDDRMSVKEVCRKHGISDESQLHFGGMVHQI